MPLYTVTTQAEVLSDGGEFPHPSYQLATPGAPPRRGAISH